MSLGAVLTAIVTPFAADGSMEFNVAIRTMTVLQDGLVHVPVGGGVVADSDPAAEYEETLVKARAMLEALGISEMTNDQAPMTNQ